MENVEEENEEEGAFSEEKIEVGPSLSTDARLLGSPWLRRNAN